MVTTNCVELMGKGTCTTPLSGNSLEELKKNIFSHAQQDHAEDMKRLTPQDQGKIAQKIEEIWQTKSAAAAKR